MAEEVQIRKASGSMLPILLLLALVIGVSLLGYFRGNKGGAGGGFSKSEIEAIISDYIKAHPEEIIASVQEMQARKSKEETEKIQQNISSKRDELEKDAASPVVGNPQGDVTVVEFFDYNCGFCKRVQPAVVKLINEDKNVRFVMKEFPILSPMSEAAARIALAVHSIAPEKYLEVHNAFMAERLTDKDSMLEIIKQKGLDVEAVTKEMDSNAVTTQINKTRALADEIGINGTPAFVINGKLIPGAISFEQMQSEVNVARKK